MSEKFQNKYRIPSARLQNWDYGWQGLYFITICTHNRENYFGKIIDKKMQLSNTGVIADILWHEIKNHAKNIELNTFVVMPNHIHGIIVLNNDDDKNDGVHVDGNNGNGNGNGNGCRDRACPVSTLPSLSSEPLQPIKSQQPNQQKTIGQKRFQNIGKNTISSIIGSYKSAVTKHARRLGYEFEWQTRFYDHIIRDDNSLQRIQNYIENNPQNWTEDKFYE